MKIKMLLMLIALSAIFVSCEDNLEIETSGERIANEIRDLIKFHDIKQLRIVYVDDLYTPKAGVTDFEIQDESIRVGDVYYPIWEIKKYMVEDFQWLSETVMVVFIE